jgi:hypothetical protein
LGEGPVLGVVAAMSMGADADAESLVRIPAQAREFTENLRFNQSQQKSTNFLLSVGLKTY